MATVMIVDPIDVKEAREILGLTQVQAGVAVGNVRSETISRWVHIPVKESTDSEK